MNSRISLHWWLVATLALVTADSPRAQTQWNEVVPSARSNQVLAYDSARNRIVMFAGFNNLVGDATGTWEWGGAVWQRRTASVEPPLRSLPGMAFDSARNRVVLFGGGGGPTGMFNDTWEWDGTNWTQRVTVNSPPARFGCASMCFDSVRGEVVLFGGVNNAGSRLNDTWVYNGTNWTLRFPAQSPPPRVHAQMVFDPSRRVSVLFGGSNLTLLGDTWEWNGMNWTQQLPPPSPTPRHGHSMAYHAGSQRVVLFGGEASSGLVADTWVYNGAWQQVQPLLAPSARAFAPMAFHGGSAECVLFGGTTGRPAGDTWAWNGVTWTNRSPTVPAARSRHAMTFDSVRVQTVLFGGVAQGGQLLGDTLTWDGTRWLAHAGSPAPGPRRGTAIAFDPVHGRTVLFGGADGSGPLNDTWEWDGTSWQLKASATPPPPAAREGHAMVFDPNTGEVVLFGGQQAGVLLPSDFWKWNGSRWLQITAVPLPLARFDHGLVGDPCTSRVRCFGGRLGIAFGLAHNDTWEWDGTRWVQVGGQTPNPARSAMAFVQDVARGRCVVFGGNASAVQPGPALSDTWEFDGTAWLQRSPALAPLPRYSTALTYDAPRGRCVQFGGTDGSVVFGDTWEYSPVHPATAQPDGPGCAGSAGVPMLAVDPCRLPWLGLTYVARVSSAPANTAGLMWLGFSNRSWGPVQLPILLDGFGMPGCQLRVPGTLTFPLSISQGSASFTLPIPNDPTLLGGGFYHQAMVVDSLANAAGVSWSNSLQARVGGR